MDIQPFAALENTVYGAIELDKIADPAIAGDRVGSPPREQDLINAGIKAQRQEELTSIISSRVFHGEVGPWIYSLSFDSTGHGKQRIWRRGLMRVWEDRGTIKQRESETCFAFERTGWQCFSRSYLHGNKYFAFGSDGRLVGYFK